MLEALLRHVRLAQFELLEWVNFHTLVRNPFETVHESVVLARQQASKCNFQEHLDVALRDRLVAVINKLNQLLVLGVVSTTINDQGCQHAAGRFQSIRMPLNKSAGWPTFVQSHLSVKTVE